MKATIVGMVIGALLFFGVLRALPSYVLLICLAIVGLTFLAALLYYFAPRRVK